MIPLESLPALQKEKLIFVLGSSHRTGSTLLQRLLNSCPKVMIWGEHIAHLNGFFRQNGLLREWGKQHADERKNLMMQGTNIFAPNIMPEEYELVDAARIYIAGLFGLPAFKLAANLGSTKAVRQMVYFTGMFSRHAFIHLT
jgi:hypothetical protein